MEVAAPESKGSGLLAILDMFLARSKDVTADGGLSANDRYRCRMDIQASVTFSAMPDLCFLDGIDESRDGNIRSSLGVIPSGWQTGQLADSRSTERS